MTRLGGTSLPLFLVDCRINRGFNLVMIFWFRKWFVIVSAVDVLCLVEVQRVSDWGSSRQGQEEASCGSTEYNQEEATRASGSKRGEFKSLFCFLNNGFEHCLAFVLRK